MEVEAQPFIDYCNVTRQEGFFAPLPCLLYKGTVGESELYIVVNGTQHGTKLIGGSAACVATMAAIERLHPDIVISSGTCGAWKKWGMNVGDVYLADGVMFHDRRVPGDDEYFTQTLGNYPVWEGTADLAKKIGVGMAKVTTGASFDMCDADEEMIIQGGGRLKEMEGAAVAFVCSLYNVPILLVKSVTDLCDVTTTNYEQFQANLKLAVDALWDVNKKILAQLCAQ